ncbi:DUF2975 domain-containing protein [Hyunsoonleella sp. SJ7]|uniref:DUF2975 domain-containing protein n=1 Tax=Hyunsoonleella aquatilis TaxID=2762758 RepID=A0A923H9E9_9FLAO|nr:DUF2975 domain-containing protein [Hyunsoonleella aquatilis]MBC3756794.1 DUF2975 domain-containing protein [Hyunsoonleella aquatilis]
MKRINLLYGFLVIVNILLASVLVVILILLVIPDFLYQKTYPNETFGIFKHFVVFLRGTLLLFGLFKIQQGLISIIKHGFYNTISESKFKRGGFFLILVGVTSIAFNIILKGEFQATVLITNFVQSFFVILVGLGLYVLADFIKSGGKLKEENDLTI